MGYPVITRLGLNQFWYRHWYSDTNFKENLKQDNSFVSLIKFYLNYGLTFSNNVFFHEYFFNKNLKWIRLSNINLNNKFFRKFYFSNSLLGIEHSYFLRYKTGEYFPLRIWLIKYSNWIIINFTCFKPVKTKTKTKKLINKEFSSVNPAFSINSSKTSFIRYKILFIFFKKKLLSNYNF